MKNMRDDIIENEINELKSMALGTDDGYKKRLLEIIHDKNKDINIRRHSLNEYCGQEQSSALPLLQEIIQDTNEDIYFRKDAVYTLSWIKIPEEKLSPFVSSLLSNEELKNEALSCLARIGSKVGLSHVIIGILDSKENWQRNSLADDLREQSKFAWKDRADSVVEALKSSNIKAADVDSAAVISAIRIPDYLRPKSQDSVIDFLIDNAIDQNSRLTDIFAKLIVDICSGSQSIAGQKIEEYERNSKIPPNKFRKLRIAIGGEIALDPLLDILERNLEKYFQEPITELNNDTLKMWQKTIRYAQYGFSIRMAMSVIVFIVGIILLSLSSWNILFGDLQGKEIFGVGVSFVTGIGMMLTIVYKGPLKEIRKSINDLGIASAAFIAYVHRVLEVSHTFSFYYLNQKITFDEMTKSSKLIDEAMNNTIILLSQKEVDLK